MLRTRTVAPRAVALTGRTGRWRGAQVVLVALALTPGGARAREAVGLSAGTGESRGPAAPPDQLSEAAGAKGVAEGTGEAAGSEVPEQLAEGTGAKGVAEETGEAVGSEVPEQLAEETGAKGVSEGTGEAAGAAATRWSAEAQRRQARGDLDGAIVGWQRALAALPTTQATAQRRAGLALAIAGAHAELAARGVPGRLQAALAVLDAYLAGLDPTDDEHRVAVEQRRAELAARLAAQRRDREPVSSRSPTLTRGPDRRLMIAGGAAIGLAGVGAAMLAASLVAGQRADEALATAVARPGDDPLREQGKQDALARGLRADRLAIASAAVGGVMLVVGVTLLVVGATRQVPRSAWTPQLAAGGLRWRF